MKIIYLLKNHKKTVLVTVFTALLLVLINFNVFYLTGYGYAEYCWNIQQNKDASNPKDFKELMQRAKEQMKSKQCELIPQRAMFGRGYVTAGNPEYAVTPELKELQKACPNSWNELPAFGLQYWVTQEVAKGDISFMDRFLPANFMIERMIDKRWSQCPSVRAKVGIPKLIEKSEGEWEFEKECIPCKAEREAAEQKKLPWNQYLKTN
jgi:hypothetical protein